MRKYFALLVALLLSCFSMIFGLLGTTWACELLFFKLVELGLIDIPEYYISKISLWCGIIIGIPFLGFLSIRWIKEWNIWQSNKK